MGGGGRKRIKARRKVVKILNPVFKVKSSEAGINNDDSSRSKESTSVPVPKQKTGGILAATKSIIMESTSRRCAQGVSKNEPLTNQRGECVICNAVSSLSCSVCGKVFYCGKVHQKKHWNSGHKSNCFPCEEMSPEEYKTLDGPLGKGPFMKASKDIQPMDKIYQEGSLLTGPGICSDFPFESVCLGCTDPIQSDQKCSTCHWPVCGPKCETETLHARYECEVFAKNGVQELNDSFQYELVRILRCLLTKYKDPEIFEKLMNLEGALKHRKTLQCLLEATKTATMFVKQNCKLTEFDDETIDHMCGVVHIQTLPSGPHRSSMQIFSFPTKLIHACDANTRFVEIILPNGENLLQVIALRHIKKGEPLTQRLLVNLEPTLDRQNFLRENYYFQCKCSVCMDPTEMGTYFSALKCHVCPKNNKKCVKDENSRYILPVTPTDLHSPWVCNYCKSEFASNVIMERMDRLENDCWIFSYKGTTGLDANGTIVAFRELIAELEKELHPNHHLVWRSKNQLFSKLTERILLMQPPSTWPKFKEMFSELEKLAKSIMIIVHKLQPGLTLARGRALHDLVAAFWGYIQWAVLCGKARSFQSHRESAMFYKLVEETVSIFELEVTEMKKVVGSVSFMRDNVHEVLMRMKRFGIEINPEKPITYSEDESDN